MNNLIHNLHLTHSQTNLQSVSIQTVINHVPLTLASVYCPPNQKITCLDFAQLFSSLGSNFVAGDDFNAKHPSWGCRSSSTRGKTLYKTLTDRTWSHISPVEPTYWPTHTNRHPDILDFFIHSTPSNLSLSIFNITDLSSDHSPVKLVIDGGINQVPKRPPLPTGPVNWA